MTPENADMIWGWNGQYSMTKCPDISFFPVPLLFTIGLSINQWQNVITTLQFTCKVNNSSDCECDLNKLALDSLGVRNGRPSNNISAGGPWRRAHSLPFHGYLIWGNRIKKCLDPNLRHLTEEFKMILTITEFPKTWFKAAIIFT